MHSLHLKVEVMKKVKEKNQPAKVKENPKTKDDKKLNKSKIPVVKNYYPEELPKR